MLTPEQHYRALENMYAKAPNNEYYHPSLHISEASATITCQVVEKFHHIAGAMHGSVYFKFLDDSAYFAANSLDFEYFVLTADFRVDLIRPFIAGKITAKGSVIQAGRKDILARSELRDENGKLLATGIGRFARSTWRLDEIKEYVP